MDCSDAPNSINSYPSGLCVPSGTFSEVYSCSSDGSQVMVYVYLSSENCSTDYSVSDYTCGNCVSDVFGGTIYSCLHGQPPSLSQSSSPSMTSLESYTQTNSQNEHPRLSPSQASIVTLTTSSSSSTSGTASQSLSPTPTAAVAPSDASSSQSPNTLVFIVVPVIGVLLVAGFAAWFIFFRSVAVKVDGMVNTSVRCLHLHLTGFKLLQYA